MSSSLRVRAPLGQSLALGAAALFLAACHHEKAPTVAPDDAADQNADAAKPTSADAGAKIKCFGVNECTGQGACDVPDGRVAPGTKGHDCAGNNSCRGKGWILATKAECDIKGGQPL
jgi:hypothetical protein